MAFEIVTPTVGNAYAFNPAIAAFNFSVPTINGIVGHFILFVLSKANAGWVDANIDKKIIG